MTIFSWDRWLGVVIKEFRELYRDYISLGLIMLIPLVQLVIYGYAVNTDTRQLPTVLINNDSGYLSRSFIQGMTNTDYFHILPGIHSEKAAKQALLQGNATFVVTIPSEFTRKILRGETPDVLVQADALDPAAIANALNAIQQLPPYVIPRDLPGSLKNGGAKPAININVHKMFNPEIIEQFNFIPGLCGTLLNSMLVLMTSLAIIREKETGSLENLLVYPLTSLEFTLGKMTPYALIGMVEAMIIVLISISVFQLPFLGNMFSLGIVTGLFVVISLAIGLIISSISQNQLQAMQLSFSYFLPSIMLSGFISPFLGMPEWAQHLGNIFPLTHFLRLIKGIMIKGSNLSQMMPDLLAMLAFTVILMAIALFIRRKTLD